MENAGEQNKSYFFPLLFLIPNFSEERLDKDDFGISKRKWQTSTFDLATLATRHKLHLPYQAMEVFLNRCNVELEIRNQPSLESAILAYHNFRIGLFLEGRSPFLSPFITSYSINSYSGINSRDSKTLSKSLPAGLEVGLKSAEGTLEAWPLELSFQCILDVDALTIDPGRFNSAVEKGMIWTQLAQSKKLLVTIADSAMAAPMLSSSSQSILHIWCGLESIFPTVQTEVSFRVSLLLSQLISVVAQRSDTFEKAKQSYVVRSKIAHGSMPDAKFEDWKCAWSLLTDAMNSICVRGQLPSEKDLLSEILK